MDNEGRSNMKCHRITQAHEFLLLRIHTGSSPGFLFPATHPSSPNLLISSTAAFKGNGSPIAGSTQTDSGQALGGYAADRLWDFPGCLSNSSMWKSECQKESQAPTPTPGSAVSGEGGTPCLSSHSAEAFLSFVTHIPLTTLPPPFQHISHTR